MKKKYFLHQTLLFTFVLCLNASSLLAYEVFNCSPNPSPDDRGKPNTCLLEALANAQPGDEIILAPGIYVGGTRSEEPFDNFSSFTSSASGTAANPIILRGSSSTNKPIITTKQGRTHSWYGLSITGDYWIIKDIEITNVAKGVMLDNANHCQLINLNVHDIGEEAIHLRSGSSNNLVRGCSISFTGRADGKEGFGEAVYVGSDRAKHSNQEGDLNDPNCNNNIIENSEIGPHISADAFDIKEGTENTVIRNSTFYADGVTGANSGDSFIDLKGIYGYVYGNTFNINPNNDTNQDVSKLNAVIDVSNRTFNGYSYKTGEFSAIFDNTINIADDKSTIPTARIILDPDKQPEPSKDVHVWENTRIPNSEWVLDEVSSEVINRFCPVWNAYQECEILSVETPSATKDFTIIQNPNSQNISIIGLSPQRNLISIYDMNGRRLKNISTKNLIKNLDLSNLSSGTYVIHIETEAVQVAKLILL